VIDLDRASLDRVLPSEPEPAGWDDVLSRSRMHEGRRRRRVVVLAAVALVVVVGAASAFAVRAFFHQGIVGLPPVGATPSTPTRGELVLRFAFGRGMGDAGRFVVAVYADGRMIWSRIGDYSRTDEYRNSTGFLERRLTPEGVELVRDEVRSSGLVDHDLHLWGGSGLYFGSIEFRTGERVVRVTWTDPADPFLNLHPDGVARQMPTPEQAAALVRLDERLEDPASWLPASAWEDPEVRAYVPSAYSVCLEGKKGLGLSRVLGLLPERAEKVLRAQELAPSHYTNLIGTFVVWCSHLTNEEARALERILDDAGVRVTRDVFGLAYRSGPFDPAYFGAKDFSIGFSPLLPDQG
jgi:hypothetical protein